MLFPATSDCDNGCITSSLPASQIANTPCHHIPSWRTCQQKCIGYQGASFGHLAPPTRIATSTSISTVGSLLAHFLVRKKTAKQLRHISPGQKPGQSLAKKSWLKPGRRHAHVSVILVQTFHRRQSFPLLRHGRGHLSPCVASILSGL